MNDDEYGVQVAGAPAPNSLRPDDDDVGHLMNWLAAMRGCTEPNATVDHGFSRAIVCIMATLSYWTGSRLYWDPKKEEITDQKPVALKVIGRALVGILEDDLL